MLLNKILESVVSLLVPVLQTPLLKQSKGKLRKTKFSFKGMLLQALTLVLIVGCCAGNEVANDQELPIGVLKVSKFQSHCL